MLHDAEKHRACRVIVDSLNATHSWNLSAHTLQNYYEFAIASLEREPDLAGHLLQMRVQNYHADHQQVEAICDSNHARHTWVMLELHGTITRILASKFTSPYRPDDGQAGLEDLAQTAIITIWQKIDTFAYKSRLNTWVYTIAVRQMQQVAKMSNTQKRALGSEAYSLEEHIEAGAPAPEAPESAPDIYVLDEQLRALIERVLIEQPDKRLITVFSLSHNEQLTLRAIGEKLELSPSRVYGMLQQAIKILQQDKSVRAWFGKDDDTLHPS
ncbi:hypothetical protein SE17_07005 [Kouleothrix aurantiaca]|jgi:RNA polymerase sigma factor (sigma-70 family)|uniref:RNA polymerase sigma-70 region 2 domain-containing protein n=1 Tax=Kouleothrix aurantiaca TaxID=186479 RepID=A0A0P9HGG4_9CHLR|nr:hypothetical protein SE17_07005 [Kouleothrix aurantiaca]